MSAWVATYTITLATAIISPWGRCTSFQVGEMFGYREAQVSDQFRSSLWHLQPMALPNADVSRDKIGLLSRDIARVVSMRRIFLRLFQSMESILRALPSPDCFGARIFVGTHTVTTNQ